MKKAAGILLLLLAQFAFAQQRRFSFSEIDDRARSIEPASPAALAIALTKDYATELEKLRSIFSWITDHIAYRVKKNYGNTSRLNNYSQRMLLPDTAQWKSANDMVAETVIQNRSAVCDGYARLFTSLCNYAGLRSAVICGFAKGDYNRQAKFRCNHTWNAVYIDSAWRLLDVTWASGYTNYSGDEFIKRYDESYFLATPEDFIRDHFPDDLRWTLMDNPSLPVEFSNAPYKNKCFSKYKIASYLPANGIIEASVGDTIQIALETADPVSDSKMTSDTSTVFDTSLQRSIAAVAYLELPAEYSNKKQLHYAFFVKDSGIEWLHIVYNHDTILRYRLKVRKEKPGMAMNNAGPVSAIP